MGNLVVLVTSPRLPAGLLTSTAWQAVEQADVVATADAEAPLAAALRAAGIVVRAAPDAGAQELLTAAAEQQVVWLAAEDGDVQLTQQLAEAVVRRSETSGAGPEVEVVVGSFDPVGARLLDAVDVMDTLRRECPWDREQTHGSLVPYLLEEAYELIEAVEAGGQTQIREELGDLLLQVLFHARLATEDADEPFSIDDVAGDLVDKLVRRHPHVFADTVVEGASDVAANWETIKRTEKSRDSAMDGIPVALPALSLADAVIGRALRGGGTVSVPVPDGETGYTEETLGEVLFALVAAAHTSGLDAERALRSRVRREMTELRRAERHAAE